MPTWSKTESFREDYRGLTATNKKKFKKAVADFVADLKKGKGFRKGLRVNGVQGADGVFEMTWAKDGRATFHGPELRPKDPHMVWRRRGSHAIFKKP